MVSPLCPCRRLRQGVTHLASDSVLLRPSLRSVLGGGLSLFPVHSVKTDLRSLIIDERRTSPNQDGQVYKRTLGVEKRRGRKMRKTPSLALPPAPWAWNSNEKEQYDTRFNTTLTVSSQSLDNIHPGWNVVLNRNSPNFQLLQLAKPTGGRSAERRHHRSGTSYRNTPTIRGNSLGDSGPTTQYVSPDLIGIWGDITTAPPSKRLKRLRRAGMTHPSRLRPSTEEAEAGRTRPHRFWLR